MGSLTAQPTSLADLFLHACRSIQSRLGSESVWFGLGYILGLVPSSVPSPAWSANLLKRGKAFATVGLAFAAVFCVTTAHSRQGQELEFNQAGREALRAHLGSIDAYQQGLSVRATETGTGRSWSSLQATHEARARAKAARRAERAEKRARRRARQSEAVISANERFQQEELSPAQTSTTQRAQRVRFENLNAD